MDCGSRLRVERFWEGVFGPAADQGTTRVVEHGPQLAGYDGIYAVLRHGSALVSAPSDLVERVRRWRVTPASVMDPRWWAPRLPGCSVLGPSIHSFADSPEHLHPVSVGHPASLADVERALAARVSVDEWAESGFGGSDVEYAWLLSDRDGQPVGASNLTPFDGMAADVGVLVTSEARGRGYGVAIAGAAVSRALELHGLARWRSLESNTASRAIAVRLGFEDDCRQLAVRPS